jgi:hypothetical protein
VNSPGNLPQIRADTGQTRYDVGDLLLEGAQFAGQRQLGAAQLEAQRDKSSSVPSSIRDALNGSSMVATFIGPLELGPNAI